MDRLAPARRPAESPIGYQTWSNLLFAHWKVPVELLRPHIPDTLEIDTFDGAAWLGLVPFQMSDVRPAWFPAVPGISRFPETNVRTYVHHRGSHPGVWFISLDAACWPAVLIARWRWHLNYFHSAMSLQRSGLTLRYRSHRADRRSSGPGRVDIEARVCESTTDPDGLPATPGTLEHFLVERYYLYTTDRAGRLYRGQVHHSPYPVKPVEVVRLEQSLTDASGVSVPGPLDHAAFSEGVTVDIFPLRRV